MQRILIQQVIVLLVSPGALHACDALVVQLCQQVFLVFDFIHLVFLYGKEKVKIRLPKNLNYGSQSSK